MDSYMLGRVVYREVTELTLFQAGNDMFVIHLGRDKG